MKYVDYKLKKGFNYVKPVKSQVPSAIYNAAYELYLQTMGYSSNREISTVTVPKYDRVEARRGVNNQPKFAKSKANGSIITSPYSIARHAVLYKPIKKEEQVSRKHRFRHIDLASRFPELYRNISYNEYTNWAYLDLEVIETQEYLVYIPEYYKIQVPAPPVVSDEGLTSALAKANEGELDLLTSLAELPETISFLHKAIRQASALVKPRRLVKSIKDMRSTKISGSWLEYRYGLMPIIYDVYGLLQVIERMGRLYETSRDRSDTDVQYEYSDSVYQYSVSGLTVNRAWVKRRYDPKNLFNSVGSLLSFNPLKTAWELVPYSFVVDWFVNIGDAISSISLTTLCEEERLCVSAQSQLLTSVSFNGHALASISSDFYSRETRDFHVPSVHLAPSLNFKRSVDAFALFWQKQRGSFQP